jgi:hypothetical protein
MMGDLKKLWRPPGPS